MDLEDLKDKVNFFITFLTNDLFFERSLSIYRLYMLRDENR